MGRFDGKYVVVTGAARGIGLAIAERFLEEGAVVLLVDRDGEGLEETCNNLSKIGPAHPFAADVSDEEAVDSLARQADGLFGGVDVLVNNAGIAYDENFLEIPIDHWDETIAVNLRGVYLVSRAIVPLIIHRGGGSVINMASTNGLVGEKGYAHYNASKGGVVLLTKTMALELAEHRIRVNAVCPGYIVTPLAESLDSPEFMEKYVENYIPLGRTGTPEDVAGVFAFLASDDAAFITGESIVVDGGQLAF